MGLQSHIRAKGKGKEALGFMTRFVDSKLTLREWLPLIGITVSAFIFNTSEFMPVGLLTGIGASFGTSEGVTGLIVSVYAWAVMLLSLPLMILGSRLAFRPLMLLVIGVFCAGQALSARRTRSCAPTAFGPGAQLWSAHGSAFGGRLRPFGVLGHCSSRGGEGRRREARAYGR